MKRLVLLMVLLCCMGHAAAAPALRLLGERRIAPVLVADGIFGGLSGIDFDSTTGRWLGASDDRAEHGPARVYQLRLEYDAKGFSAAAVEGFIVLSAPAPARYRSPSQAGPMDEVPDIEALRIDPADGSLWYASEGNAVLGHQPFVRRATRSGIYLTELPLGPQFRLQGGSKHGVRANRAVEALAFDPGGRSLWVALEAPLVQDGSLPDLSHGSPVRFTRFGRDGAVWAQFVYPVDPIPAAPAVGKTSDNGVAEILVLDDERLLVLERAGVQGDDGHFRFFVRLYLADLRGATDVSAIAALPDQAYVPVRKYLIADLNRMVGDPGNLEAMAWGPHLAGGGRSLVLATDDNFDGSSGTHFFAFEFVGVDRPISENP